MYVEAEAKMDTYQAQDGSNRTQLNLLQRESLPHHSGDLSRRQRYGLLANRVMRL